MQLSRIMTVPLQQCPRMESINDVQYKGAITEVLVVKKESVINNHKHLFSVHESATVDRSTTGH